MNKHEKTVKILESFLETYTMDGICTALVDSNEEAKYEEDRISVHIVLDLDWVNKEFTKPGFVANRMRAGLKEEIKKYTGLDVYVGSTAKKCSESLSESISVYLRRRLSIDDVKEDLNNLVDYDMNPCSFENAGEFISETCNIMVDVFGDNLVRGPNNTLLTPEEKDELYYYFIDTFGLYLGRKYEQMCVRGIRESKKTYIVTESQYKKLLNEDPEEISKENAIKFYKLFKRIMDGKFSELTYDENPYWSTHEDDASWKDSNRDIVRYRYNTFLIERKFYWTFLNYLPISHTTTKLMFTRYFRERFPDKFFLSVIEFDA